MQLKASITFKQWISTDRCELVTTVKSTEEFIESLLEKLLLLLRHSFIATQQAMFLKELRCNLQSGEFVPVKPLCFILQNERIIFSEVSRNHRTGNIKIKIIFKKKLRAD
jgi:hypothetical protein